MDAILAKKTLPTREEYKLINEEPELYEFEEIHRERIDFGGGHGGTPVGVRKFTNFSTGNMKFTRPRSRGLSSKEWMYASSEHVYQLEKLRLASTHPDIDDEKRDEIIEAYNGILDGKKLTPSDLKTAVKGFWDKEGFIPQVIIKEWHEELKIGVMRWVLHKKFGVKECFQNGQVGENCRKDLLATKDAYLRELCKGHEDRFFGFTRENKTRKWKNGGKNILGRLLMEERDRLKRGPDDEGIF